MIKKSFPVQKPYYYDTKDGIDHFTKLLVEENPKKLSPKELQDIDKLGKDMKRAVLDHHIKTVKPFDNFDSSTFPSDPKVRGKLLEIEKLEKDLTPPKPRSRTGNPSGRDYWKEYVASGGKKLPEVSPEDRNQLSASDTWKGIYEGMTPFEKGQWNAEQRKKKLQHQKEFEEEKKQKRIANHTKRQWGIPDKKSVNYLSNNYSFEENFKKQSKNINYQKMPNQDLKNNMKKWINEADTEKKQEVNKPLSTHEKPVEHFVLPSQRVTPVKPEYTQSLDQRLKHSRSLPPGLSIELVKLQKDIDRNINYVLGADQKDNLESRNKETTNKEELE